MTHEEHEAAFRQGVAYYHLALPWRVVKARTRDMDPKLGSVVAFGWSVGCCYPHDDTLTMPTGDYL